jgi:hypothetical protein
MFVGAGITVATVATFASGFFYTGEHGGHAGGLSKLCHMRVCDTQSVDVIFFPISYTNTVIFPTS